MKRNHLTTAILMALLNTISLNAQDYWQKTYPNGVNYGNVVDVQETSDGSFVFLGNDQWPGTSQTKIIRLLKITSSGDIQWGRHYLLDITDYFTSLRLTSDGGYALAGRYFNAPSLIKTDINGDTLFKVQYLNNPEYAPSFVRLFTNGDYLLAGSKNVPTGTLPFLMRIDPNGDVLWSKDILDTITNNSYIVDIEIINDNEFVYLYNDEFPQLAASDSNGVVLWTTGFYNSENIRLNAFTSSGDNTFVTAGYTSDSTGDKPFMAEINIAGDILWSKEAQLSDCQANSIETAPDGYIVGMSCFFSMDSTISYFYKIDMTGDKLWKRSYPGLIKVAYPTSDGGYIGCGLLDNNMMLIKTNALGEITSNNDPDDLPVLNIFPNPASDHLELKFGNGLSEVTRLDWLSVNGQLLNSTALAKGTANYQLSIASELSGVYLIRLVQGEKVSVRKIVVQR